VLLAIKASEHTPENMPNPRAIPRIIGEPSAKPRTKEHVVITQVIVVTFRSSSYDINCFVNFHLKNV